MYKKAPCWKDLAEYELKTFWGAHKSGITPFEFHSAAYIIYMIKLCRLFIEHALLLYLYEKVKVIKNFLI